MIGFADWRKAFNVNGAVERERFPIRELHQVEVRPVARNISRGDHVPCIRHLHGGVAEICVVQEIEDGIPVLHVAELEVVHVKVFHIPDRDVFLPLDGQRVAAVGGCFVKAHERGFLQIGCGCTFGEDDLVVRRNFGARAADHIARDGATGDFDDVAGCRALIGTVAEDVHDNRATGDVTFDRATGDYDAVARRGAIPGIAAVDDVVDRAAGDCDSVFRHGTLLGSAAVDPCIIIDHAALDDHMVVREVICPPE